VAARFACADARRRIYSPLPLALVLSSRVSWFNKALVRAVGLLQWPQDGVLKLLRAICGWTADPDTNYWRNHKKAPADGQDLSPMTRLMWNHDPAHQSGAKGIRTPLLTRENAVSTAVSFRLVPIQYRSLPAVSFRVLTASRAPMRRRILFDRG
jgi:hypothetical protein